MYLNPINSFKFSSAWNSFRYYPPLPIYTKQSLSLRVSAKIVYSVVMSWKCVRSKCAASVHLSGIYSSYQNLFICVTQDALIISIQSVQFSCFFFFYVHISVHHKSMYLEDQRDAVLSSLYLLYCQVTLFVSCVSRTHHQEYTNCSYNHWYKSWIWRWPWPSEVAAFPWTLFNRIISLHLQIHDLYQWL